MPSVVGIDNGLDGGLIELKDGQVSRMLIMPTITIKGKKKRRDYDDQAIIAFLLEVNPVLVVLEKSQAYPQQGGVSNWTTGHGAGIIRGIVAALRFPRMVVHPKTWQTKFFSGFSHEDTKAASFIVCRQLWPTIDWKATPRCKNFHDGLCDAALLAEFGRREFSAGAGVCAGDES